MKKIFVVCLISLFLVAGLYTNCGRTNTNPESGDGPSSGTTIGEPLSVVVGRPFTPPSPGFRLLFCAVGLDIYDNNNTLMQIPLVPEGIELDPAGANIAEYAPFLAFYRNVYIRIDNSCGEGVSMIVGNGNGTFSTSAPVRIGFTGNSSVIGSIYMDLDFQTLVDGFAQATSNASLPSIANSVSGTFTTR